MTMLTQSSKSKYRITLDLDVYSDFNPRDINWDKLFDLGGTEAVNAYIENLSYDSLQLLTVVKLQWFIYTFVRVYETLSNNNLERINGQLVTPQSSILSLESKAIKDSIQTVI